VTRSSTTAAVAGALSAALLVAFLKGSILGISVGALLSPLPLAMAALGLGLVYLPVAVVGGAVTVTVLTGSFALAVVYLLVDAVPVAALSRLGMLAAANDAGTPARGAAIGRTVSYLAIGAAVFVALGLFLMPHPEGIEAGLRGWVDEILAAVPKPTSVTGEEFATARAEFTRAAASLLPGAVTWDWALRGLLSVALAQHMLKRMGLALWATPAYRTFGVPGWFFGVFAVLAGVGLVIQGDIGFVASNSALALGLPPLLQGLAVVHCGSARLSHSTIWLLGFYFVALLVPVIALLVLVSLAAMDHFLQLRSRYLSVSGPR
jgi:hypothetical protein